MQDDPLAIPTPQPPNGPFNKLGAILKRTFVGAPQEERYQAPIEAATRIADPFQRAQALIQVQDQMTAEGLRPNDTGPLLLKGHVDRAIADMQAIPATTPQDAVQRAYQIQHVKERFGQAAPVSSGTIGQMLRLPGQMQGDTARVNTYNAQTGTEKIKQDVTLPASAAASRARAGAAGAQAGLANTRAADVTATQPGRIAAESALGGERNAQAGLATARTGDITATQPARIDVMEARRNKYLQPDGFHVPIHDPATGKTNVLLYDKAGLLVRNLGEAPPQKENPLADLANQLRQNLPGGVPAAVPPPAAPTSAPQGQSPASAPAPEDTRQLNGKTYVKINGQWFEQ